MFKNGNIEVCNPRDFLFTQVLSVSYFMMSDFETMMSDSNSIWRQKVVKPKSLSDVRPDILVHLDQFLQEGHQF